MKRTRYPHSGTLPCRTVPRVNGRLGPREAGMGSTYKCKLLMPPLTEGDDTTSYRTLSLVIAPCRNLNTLPRRALASC